MSYTDVLGIKPGAKIGGLGIELHTRRRNRVNGTLLAGHAVDPATSSLNATSSSTSSSKKQTLLLAVDHAFGNCPKYISTRNVQLLDQQQNRDGPRAEEVVTQTGPLGVKQLGLISAADTFFIATSFSGNVASDSSDGLQAVSAADDDGGTGTAAAARVPTAGARKNSSETHLKSAAAAAVASFGCDVSHRGGSPGFVMASSSGMTLAWPEYAGNNHFNSLGELIAWLSLCT